MKYHKTIILKNGKECCLRNGEESDGLSVLENFDLTHAETDYLLSYPDENSFDEVQESRFLKEKTESENEIEILAVIDGVVAGTAGIEALGTKYKVRHRAEFGISVAREFWGLGIGCALMDACIEHGIKLRILDNKSEDVYTITRSMTQPLKKYRSYEECLSDWYELEVSYPEIVELRVPKDPLLHRIYLIRGKTSGAVNIKY